MMLNDEKISAKKGKKRIFLLCFTGSVQFLWLKLSCANLCLPVCMCAHNLCKGFIFAKPSVCSFGVLLLIRVIVLGRDWVVLLWWWCRWCKPLLTVLVEQQQQQTRIDCSKMSFFHIKRRGFCHKEPGSLFLSELEWGTNWNLFTFELVRGEKKGCRDLISVSTTKPQQSFSGRGRKELRLCVFCSARVWAARSPFSRRKLKNFKNLLSLFFIRLTHTHAESAKTWTYSSGDWVRMSERERVPSEWIERG